MNNNILYPKFYLLFTIFLCLNVFVISAQNAVSGNNKKKSTELPDKGVPLAVNTFPVASKTYANKGKITSFGRIEEHQKIVFKSEYAIELNPGFETIEGATFEAYIESNVVPVAILKSNTNQSTIALGISPNPASESLNVFIQSETEGLATFDIFNTHGSVILTKSTQVFKGQQQIAVDCSTMPDGIYVAIITINGTKKGEKFIVNRH